MVGIVRTCVPTHSCTHTEMHTHAHAHNMNRHCVYVCELFRLLRPHTHTHTHTDANATYSALTPDIR